MHVGSRTESDRSRFIRPIRFAWVALSVLALAGCYEVVVEVQLHASGGADIRIEISNYGAGPMAAARDPLATEARGALDQLVARFRDGGAGDPRVAAASVSTTPGTLGRKHIALTARVFRFEDLDDVLRDWLDRDIGSESEFDLQLSIERLRDEPDSDSFAIWLRAQFRHARLDQILGDPDPVLAQAMMCPGDWRIALAAPAILELSGNVEPDRREDTVLYRPSVAQLLEDEPLSIRAKVSATPQSERGGVIKRNGAHEQSRRLGTARNTVWLVAATLGIVTVGLLAILWGRRRS